jgi:hypothetical protein
MWKNGQCIVIRGKGELCFRCRVRRAKTFAELTMGDTQRDVYKLEGKLPEKSYLYGINTFPKSLKSKRRG